MLSRSRVTSSSCAFAVNRLDFLGVASLTAFAMCVIGSYSCFNVNLSRFAALMDSLGCTRESRFSGRLDSLDPLVKRAIGPSIGLTAPEEDPPLLVARKPLFIEIELDCLECAALIVDAELERLSSIRETSLTRSRSFVGLRVGTKPCRLCLRLADDDAVSLLLRLISPPPVRSGATPGLFMIVGAFVDATRACDRCGTGGGRCSED
jgi:hypothetical protein